MQCGIENFLRGFSSPFSVRRQHRLDGDARLLHSIRIAIEIETSSASNSLNAKAITDHAQLDIPNTQNLLGFVVILKIKGYRHAGLLDQP